MDKNMKLKIEEFWVTRMEMEIEKINFNDWFFIPVIEIEMESGDSDGLHFVCFKYGAGFLAYLGEEAEAFGF